MSWSSENPLIYKTLKDYIAQYADSPGGLHLFLKSSVCESFLSACNNDSEQQKCGLVILAGALNQGIKEPRLFEFMSLLISSYGEKLFALPALDYEALKRVTHDFCSHKYWEIKDQVPGIIWSVGEFIRDNNIASLMKKLSYAEMISLLSNSIFYMGATSISKQKARRLYNWLALPYPVGIGLNIKIDTSICDISISESAHRFMYDFGPLKGKTTPFPDQEARKSYYKKFYSFLSPGFPQLIEHVFYFLDSQHLERFKL